MVQGLRRVGLRGGALAAALLLAGPPGGAQAEAREGGAAAELAAPEAPAASGPGWSVRCDTSEPCQVLIEGEVALRTGRGALRCAEKDGVLGCLFSGRAGRRHEAWFVGLADRAVRPIRIDPGQALLAEPVWDPDGLRIMLRRADGSLGTRTVRPPPTSPASPAALGWARVIGSLEDAPSPVRLAIAEGGPVFTLAGPRFALDDGREAGVSAWNKASKAGLRPVDLALLPGGDALLLSTVDEGARGFHGARPVHVVGGARGGSDLLLLRISPEGETRWRRVWGSAGVDTPVALEVAGEVLRVEARYAGLVDLDPEDGTRLVTPAPATRIVSLFDPQGHLLGPPRKVPRKVPPECQTAPEVLAGAPAGASQEPRTRVGCRCALRPGAGSVPRARLMVDLRENPDQPSTWVGCFLGQEPLWMLVAPVGVELEDAKRAGGRLCLGGQARGGPHDLSPRPGENLWVGVPEVESVAFVACLPLGAFE